ncbi:MAG: hypothetical protein CVU03_05435 [Bacteroidetes bacterium HGW-Bacteroidetes-2]|jgi:hypothetical protein|nr:MAG: hypothetical protein CVU03_05435 [Bacteroidetes bacterium HGW-Bacteroidetes-2]
MLYKTTLFVTVFLTSLVSAQVGVGTEYPVADLHVAGEMLVQETFSISKLPSVTNNDEDFKLLTRITNSNPLGEITVLDVDSLTVAPVNVVNYIFTDIALDNLSDVNLQYDANKYIVGIANFRYLGDAIKKNVVGDKISIGTFVIRTFISGGLWHLEIKNRDLDLDVGDVLEYHITFIIYDKSYYRNLPPIITNLNGSNTGSASSIPDLY